AEHGVDIHQPAGFEAGLVMRRLRAIAAILRTAARLYRQERAELDLTGTVPFTMRGLRAPHQFEKRKIEQRRDIGARPVASQGRAAHLRRSGELMGTDRCVVSVHRSLACSFGSD